MFISCKCVKQKVQREFIKPRACMIQVVEITCQRVAKEYEDFQNMAPCVKWNSLNFDYKENLQIIKKGLVIRNVFGNFHLKTKIVSFTLSTNKKCYELINLSRGEDY